MTLNQAHRYAATDSGRFSWRTFAQEASDEVVVFDRQTGNTHRINGTALTLLDRLRAEPRGLTPAGLLASLWANDTPKDEQESTQVETACLAMLSQLVAMGMVRESQTSQP